MKATLEFDLPNESEPYCAAVDGATLLYTIKEFDKALRDAMKYEHMPDGAPATVEQQRAAEQWRTVLRETLEANGVAWVLE